MLYSFLYYLRDVFSGFNVFRYITFRAILAVVTSFSLTVFLGPFLIAKLKNLKIGEIIKRDECISLYEIQHHKQGTPTMGGILIVVSVLFSTMLWADLSNKFISMVIFACFWLSLLGFLDDYLKIKRNSSSGLSANLIFFGQVSLALLLACMLFLDKGFNSSIYFPFLKGAVFNMGTFFIIFVILVIVGSSNAVNLTDGLDGLACGCMIMVALAYGALSYIVGHKLFSSYLFIHYVEGAGELAVFCASIFGAVLGFLWFNCYPASIFMGNVGSLALGGAIGLVAVLIKQEFLLFVVGGVFVIEVISVILQVLFFRFKGKRIFKMTPLHHHFQLLGWSESKIIVRFWIVAVIFALLALATLKLR
ncbi:MAG: phospho-N-acetylmuramoyl-pentapeptide-transferase [Candidatus Omnitrophica bacterium]|nr:phospho-N-acetylmuramoyl-pentapeptide-transferase [Candidatus Omnitrophota bacterium]